MSCVPFSGPLGTATLVGNSYSYDKANRLTMSDFGYYYTPDSTWHTTPAYDANYAYDNVGNFTTLQRYGSTGSIQDNLTYTYTQGTNKVSSINSSLAVYNYDSNGNVKYDTHRGIGFMIYDPDNLPVTAYLTNGEQLIYENDVNGNRVRNTISGSSDNYYFNGADGKTEAVALLPLSNVTYNILGAGGDNIGQLRVINSNPARYYYLKDHLGSIKMTVDATGTVQGYDDYYPYGMQMTGRSMTSSEDGRYKFTGKERDASDGLDYFGKRYYDSWKAGWDQTDPMKDKYQWLSPYNYCQNNPLRNIDPDGNWGTDVIKGKYFLTVMSVQKMNLINAALLIPKSLNALNIAAPVNELVKMIAKDNIFTRTGHSDVGSETLKDNTINRLNPLAGIAEGLLSTQDVANNREVDERAFKSNGIDKLYDNPVDKIPLFCNKELTAYQLENYDPGTDNELNGELYLQVNPDFIAKYKDWNTRLENIVQDYEIPYQKELQAEQDKAKADTQGQ
jgi:RHS repeat-associated protein